MHQLICLSLSCLFALIAFQSKAQNEEQLKQQHFYFGSKSYQLNEEAKSRIDQFLATNYAASHIQIKAYTDDLGSIEENKILAENRAITIANYLESKGIPSRKITLLPIGQITIDENSKESIKHQRQNNRKVLVEYRSKPISKDYNLADFFREERLQAQQSFSFNPKNRASIVGEKGTVLDIPPNILVRADGSPAVGIVEATLQEAYSYGDMLRQNLSTTSQGRLLETGGMFKLTITDSEGQELQIKEGTSLTASLPSKEASLEGMQVFEGTEDDAHNVDWLATERYLRPTYFPEEENPFADLEARLNQLDKIPPFNPEHPNPVSRDKQSYQAYNNQIYAVFQELNEAIKFSSEHYKSNSEHIAYILFGKTNRQKAIEKMVAEAGTFLNKSPDFANFIKKVNSVQISRLLEKEATEIEQIAQACRDLSSELFFTPSDEWLPQHVSDLKTYLGNPKELSDYNIQLIRKYHKALGEAVAFNDLRQASQAIQQTCKDKKLLIAAFLKNESELNANIEALKKELTQLKIKHEVLIPKSILDLCKVQENIQMLSNIEACNRSLKGMAIEAKNNLWRSKDFYNFSKKLDVVSSTPKSDIAQIDALIEAQYQAELLIDSADNRQLFYFVVSLGRYTKLERELPEVDIQLIERYNDLLRENADFQNLVATACEIQKRCKKHENLIEKCALFSARIETLEKAFEILKVKHKVLLPAQIMAAYNNRMQIDKLGWINCDRFSNSQQSLMNLDILTQRSSDTEVFVIFEDRQSIMRAVPSFSGHYSLNGLPQYQRVKLVGIRVTAGEAEIFVEEGSVGELNGIKPVFSKKTLAEASAMMGQL